MISFETKLPHVIFGRGASCRIGELLADCGVKNALVIYDEGIKSSGILEPILDTLREEDVAFVEIGGVKSDPTYKDIDAAGAIARESGVDAVLAIGGGSVMDTGKGVFTLLGTPGSASVLEHTIGGRGLGKPIARPAGVTFMLVPTTSGTGSEVSTASVITDDEINYKALMDGYNLTADYAVLDPCLDAGMPRGLTANTAMDALTHAMESYIIGGVVEVIKPQMKFNVWAEMLSLEATRRIYSNIRTVLATPNDLEARAEVKYGCMLASMAMCSGGLTIGHGMGQAMGSIWHIPHGTSVAMCLPIAIRQGAKLDINTRERVARLAEAMGISVPPTASKEDIVERLCRAIEELIDEIGIPTLRQLGKTRESLDEAVASAMQSFTCLISATEDELREYFGYLFDR